MLQCRKCSGAYKTRRGMKAHITSNCGLKIESKLQKCPKCNKQFKKLHLHVDHCRDLARYCAHCPYSTENKSHLIRHLRSHLMGINFKGQQKSMFIDKYIKLYIYTYILTLNNIKVQLKWICFLFYAGWRTKLSKW